MFQVTEYTIVTADQLHLLAHDVNDMLKNGWQPFGNIVHSPDNRYDNFGQAMVKVSAPYLRPPLSEHSLPLNGQPR
jgi:hypothetical protein